MYAVAISTASCSDNIYSDKYICMYLHLCVCMSILIMLISSHANKISVPYTYMHTYILI